jgi:hypothetical protein
MTVRRWSALVAAGVIALVFQAHRASACGGFFCNQPLTPTDLPVAQTGENVLFAMDRAPDGRNHLEAHIQIFYTGPADHFSWVVPVDGLPTLDVGSNRIFTLLDQATRPQFQLTMSTEGICRDEGVGVLGTRSASDSSAKSDGGAGGPRPTSMVEVVSQGDVGPFAFAVVRSDDPGALKSWLRENLYYLSDQAAALIDDYVREGKYFVALKLQPGKGVSEIRPIVLRFDGPGPCVPLRLTAIAALRDLRINLWVLAEHRVVPENYFEIEINEAKIDWIRGGQNYPDLVKQAADEAGGNAFAVDFAGPTASLRASLGSLAVHYDLSRLATLSSPPDVLDEIARLGLPRDSALLEILRKHIPEPQVYRDMGISETTFYNQLRSFYSQSPGLFAPVDPAALVKDIDDTFIQPLQRAGALFDAHPRLTRLTTFISPEEMSVDPLFTENTTLGDVPAVRAARGFLVCGLREYTRCQAPIRAELPGGQTVWYRAPQPDGWCGNPSAGYDRGGLDGMPSLQAGWMRQTAGDGLLRFDNRAAIARAVAAQNARVQSGCSCALGGRAGAAPAVLLLAGLALVVRRRWWRR